jgi:hypothetical protein
MDDCARPFDGQIHKPQSSACIKLATKYRELGASIPLPNSVPQPPARVKAASHRVRQAHARNRTEQRSGGRRVRGRQVVQGAHRVLRCRRTRQWCERIERRGACVLHIVHIRVCVFVREDEQDCERTGIYCINAKVNTTIAHRNCASSTLLRRACTLQLRLVRVRVHSPLFGFLGFDRRRDRAHERHRAFEQRRLAVQQHAIPHDCEPGKMQKTSNRRRKLGR